MAPAVPGHAFEVTGNFDNLGNFRRWAVVRPHPLVTSVLGQPAGIVLSKVIVVTEGTGYYDDNP